MYGTRVLVVLPLFVVLAHSFSWDIVVGSGKWLEFYNNGTLTRTKDNPSSRAIRSVTYDPVDFRVLFADQDNTNITISSFDLTTRKIQTLVTKEITTAHYMHLAYDPIKQLLFWSQDTEIYSISLKPASSNEKVEANRILKLQYYCKYLAVDSCGGYIYWITDPQIERAAFDGSEREVIVAGNVYGRRNLVIDQQTQRMIWCEEISDKQNAWLSTQNLIPTNRFSIESADLDGKNRMTYYYIGYEIGVTALTVSKDYIYWKSYKQDAILRLPKHREFGVEPTVYDSTLYGILSWDDSVTAANYTIEEQALGMKTCEALKSLTHRSSAKL